MLKVLVLFCLAAFVVAKEKSQCEIKNNVEEADWKALNANESNPSEKMLCLFKCFHEENGTVNSAGVVNPDKLIENLQKQQTLTDASKASIRECVKDLPPIKTCADVKNGYLCILEVIQKQTPKP